MLKPNNYLFHPTRISLLLGLLFIAGCSNTYYFNKKIDDFHPSPNKVFNVIYPDNKGYNPIIGKKLTEKIKDIPLQYTSTSYAEYTAYFRYKRAYFIYPMLGVVIYQNANRANPNSHPVYEAVVYSYNTNLHEGLAASLKIITDDILNASYKKGGKLVKLTPEDLQKSIEKHREEVAKQKAINQQKAQEEAATNTVTPLRDYRLFDKDSDYDW